RPDHFKLSANFLNLLGLLPEARSEGLNLPFLQSDHCSLSFSCGLQFLHDLTLFEHLAHRDRRIRRDGAEVAARVDNHRDAARYSRARDAADKAACVTRIADAYRVVLVSTRGNAPADIDVERTLDARARGVTDSSVPRAADVIRHCVKTQYIVLQTIRVTAERV